MEVIYFFLKLYMTINPSTVEVFLSRRDLMLQVRMTTFLRQCMFFFVLFFS